jgi:hypothetical protein
VYCDSLPRSHALRIQHSRENVMPSSAGPRSAATTAIARNPALARLQALGGNENVGGDGHDCDMSELHIIYAGTDLVWELWVSTEAPLVDVDSSARLR